MLLTKSPNSCGKNCSAPRALQVEKYSALTKFCSALNFEKNLTQLRRPKNSKEIIKNTTFRYKHLIYLQIASLQKTYITKKIVNNIYRWHIYKYIECKSL